MYSLLFVFEGRFKSDYLEIPANGKAVMLRYGQHYQVENGKVVWAHILLDLLDLMRQVQSGCMHVSLVAHTAEPTGPTALPSGRYETGAV